jgi:DNA helicase-2/ATP-dependent DNA helicase PcrA
VNQRSLPRLLTYPEPHPLRSDGPMEICALRQSLLDCPGHALVLGGPGSGKTTIALKKAVVRITAGLAPGQSVLFLSFSRAAVARLGEAMKQEVPKAQRNQLSMQTFHSFFWSLLSTHAYLLGVPTRLKILLPQDEQIEYGPIKRRDRNENNAAWRAWLVERERLFRAEGRIAFDLFAPNAEAILTASGQVRRLVAQRHPLIIVDEAQDTDAHAWRCIQLLAPLVQIVCLADLEQQIFDHLPGIGPERVAAIREYLAPHEIDLGGQNHRSGGTEIANFGQDILSGRVRGAPYAGVSALSYNPQQRELRAVVRSALGMLHRAIRINTGTFGRTVAILSHSGSSAAKISAALNEEPKPVRHKLAFDEAEACWRLDLPHFCWSQNPKRSGWMRRRWHLSCSPPRRRPRDWRPRRSGAPGPQRFERDAHPGRGSCSRFAR